jgi:hypothetical protein
MTEEEHNEYHRYLQKAVGHDYFVLWLRIKWNHLDIYQTDWV